MKIKVWDAPTRIFHWSLVLAYAVAFFTSRSEWFLEYHVVAGYAALGLVLFRIAWGFAGNRWARFNDFVKGPREFFAYLAETARLHPKRYLGHNPASGWMILAKLVITAIIAITGVVVLSGEEMSGIFAGYFSFQSAQVARPVHIVLSYLSVVIIVAHVIAVLFHEFFLNENIVIPMFTGEKEDAATYDERVSHLHTGDVLSSWKLAAYVFAAILGGLGLIFLRPEGKTDIARLEQPKVFDPSGIVVAIPVNEAWKTECAESCHRGFHPTLMPQASWEEIMAGLDDHFGEPAELDTATAAEILGYLVSTSAERATTEAGRKMLHSIKDGKIPLRITDIPYWIKKHSDIPPEIFKRKSVVAKTNCPACHPGAELGSFEDRDIVIPRT